MTIDELTREQLADLKQKYIIEHNDGAGVSWGMLADPDACVSDDTIKKEYAGVSFMADDFTA